MCSQKTNPAPERCRVVTRGKIYFFLLVVLRRLATLRLAGFLLAALRFFGAAALRFLFAGIRLCTPPL